MPDLEVNEHLCQDEEDTDRIVRRSIAISLKRIADRLDSWNGLKDTLSVQTFDGGSL